LGEAEKVEGEWKGLERGKGNGGQEKEGEANGEGRGGGMEFRGGLCVIGFRSTDAPTLTCFD